MRPRRREHPKLVHDLLAQGAGIRQIPDTWAGDGTPSSATPGPPPGKRRPGVDQTNILYVRFVVRQDPVKTCATRAVG
jgi:hypothetical protein